MNLLIQLKQTTSVFLVAFALACFGHLSTVQAVSPAPDGGYPGGNTAEGQAALLSLTTGRYNTAVGIFALRNDTTSSFNTALGAGALLANTADENTATGAGALLSNTNGMQNTANGAFALFSDTIGQLNTALGDRALFRNTTGSANVASGWEALEINTTGNENTATGASALAANTNGNDNTATGASALESNTHGSQNTANGSGTLFFNTTGSGNTANGFDALLSNDTGFNNTASGYQALHSNSAGFENTAVGYQALFNCTGAGNTAVGYLAGQNLTTGNDNIDIGNDGVAGDAGIIRIGRSFIGATYIAGIFGVTASGGTAVYVNSSGQLGTATSSARFKEDIKPMDKASEAILALKPVTFRYKKEIDSKGIPQFGLVAEDVEKVNRDLIVRDKEGKPYSVRYDQVNTMLLNEFLKEHRIVQEQGATIMRLQKQIDALTAGLQKVSAQLEVSKSAPRTVLNNQ